MAGAPTDSMQRGQTDSGGALADDMQGEQRRKICTGG